MNGILRTVGLVLAVGVISFALAAENKEKDRFQMLQSGETIIKMNKETGESWRFITVVMDNQAKTAVPAWVPIIDNHDELERLGEGLRKKDSRN